MKSLVNYINENVNDQSVKNFNKFLMRKWNKIIKSDGVDANCTINDIMSDLNEFDPDDTLNKSDLSAVQNDVNRFKNLKFYKLNQERDGWWILVDYLEEHDDLYDNAEMLIDYYDQDGVEVGLWEMENFIVYDVKSDHVGDFFIAKK